MMLVMLVGVVAVCSLPVAVDQVCYLTVDDSTETSGYKTCGLDGKFTFLYYFNCTCINYDALEAPQVCTCTIIPYARDVSLL